MSEYRPEINHNETADGEGKTAAAEVIGELLTEGPSLGTPEGLVSFGDRKGSVTPFRKTRSAVASGKDSGGNYPVDSLLSGPYSIVPGPEDLSEFNVHSAQSVERMPRHEDEASVESLAGNGDGVVRGNEFPGP